MLLSTVTSFFHLQRPIAVAVLLVLSTNCLVCGSTTNHHDTTPPKDIVPTNMERTCQTSVQLWNDHPMLCAFLEQLYGTDGGAQQFEVLQHLHQYALESGQIVDLRSADSDTLSRSRNKQQQSAVVALKQRRRMRQEQQADHTNDEVLPIVIAHGMGDSCFNDGMAYMVQSTSALFENRYTVCIPIGTTQPEDTKNGYFLSMDDSVDIFADTVRNDTMLSGGFHAVGFSQGNNIIRGYITKYNDVAPVHSFISINGVNAGTGAVPYCLPKTTSSLSLSSALAYEEFKFSMCNFLMEQASGRAYTEFAQQHSFQANYWRDPRESAKDDYYKYSQLAEWNNEIPNQKNSTYNENWGRTSVFVWIRATHDQMIYPNEGEHWGSYDSSASDPFSVPVLAMKETDWYVNDYFGLRTAEEQNKNYYESFDGDHLRFTMEDYTTWLLKYITT